MSYPRGLPPQFEPEPYVEPLTPERFVGLLEEYVDVRMDRRSGRDLLDGARLALEDAVRELFRRLAQ